MTFLIDVEDIEEDVAGCSTVDLGCSVRICWSIGLPIASKDLLDWWCSTDARIGSADGCRITESIDLIDSIDLIASVERMLCSIGRMGDGSVDLHGLLQHRGMVFAPSLMLPPLPPLAATPPVTLPTP